MMKLQAAVAVATLTLSGPVFGQNSTQMVSGPGVTCTPKITSTSVAPTSTMALGVHNRLNVDRAHASLSHTQANLDRFAQIFPRRPGVATTVCIVDLDILALSDATLQADTSKYRSDNLLIRAALEGNATIMLEIKAQHPSFEIDRVVGTDISPSGELVLYVSQI